MQAVITPLGDNAITIIFGDVIDENINQQVFSLFYHLREQNIYGIKDIIPAYASLTVVYDILKISEVSKTSAYDHIHNVVEEALSQPNSKHQTPTKRLRVPVCYDVSLGIDLTNMSEEKNIGVDDIIQLHANRVYRVYMIGFLPGFAYMGKVDDRIATPRKTTPHKNVLEGSVGIADSQTGIYPLNSPGGWNIIGATPMQLFDVHSEQPCLFQPGDEVKFEPIGLEQFYRLKQ
jgi:inhibitor of KinA